METRSNLRRKELHGANQDSNFLRHSFIYKYHVRTWIQFKRENKHLKIYFSNHIQDEIFQVCSQMGGAKRPPSINLSYISYNDGTWHSYTLPKQDPKNIWIVLHTPWVLLTSAVFQGKSANFAISKNTDIDGILIHIS